MALRKLKQKTKSLSVKEDLKRSSLEVFDIPVDKIDLSADNPNEQDEKTFNSLCDRIKTDGFFEPVHVIPLKNGRYQMVGGEHRYKAVKYLGYKTIPAIIHKDWDDTKAKIELVAQNMLRGNLNKEKFTKLWDSLRKKGIDNEMLKAQMGFTKTDQFEKVYQAVSNGMDAKQKKKLKEAKETIKSVDDLSTVLNTIFKDHGNELDSGFLVFSFGGKNHHYIQIDKESDIKLKRIEEHCENAGISVSEYFKDMLNKVKV